MEEVQKLKYKLEGMGITYVPATVVAIKDIQSRIEYDLPDSVRLLLSEIGNYKVSDDVHGLGLDVSQLSADMYLRYMVLTSSRSYPKVLLPVMRFGLHRYLTINLVTEEMSMIDVTDRDDIVAEPLSSDLWTSITVNL